MLVEATLKKKKKKREEAVEWKRGTDALYPTYLLQNGPPPSHHVMITITWVLSLPWRFLEMPRLTLLLIDQPSGLKIDFGDSLPGKLLKS